MAPPAFDNESPEPADLPKTRRRWLQISLRAFLILFTASALLLGVFVNRAHRQKVAIDRVRALGGQVVFDFQGGINSPYDRNAAPPGPRWLRQLIPPEHVDEVTAVNFIRSTVSDEDFALFESLPDVQRINLSECNGLTGRGFQYLRGLNELTTIYVHATPITDEGVTHIKDMRRLESVMLYSAITDHGVEDLSQMEWLQELRVGSEHISRRWATDLRKALPNCKIGVGFTMY